MPPETRYMRSDQHTINGLTAYKLGIAQSTTYGICSEQAYDLVRYDWGIRVWKRSSGGTETEITSGIPVATVYRTSVGAGIQSNTWACPQTTLDSTDAIVVRVYGKLSAWILLRTFITEQLDAQQLDSSTWTVYYYTQLSYDPIEELYNYVFWHGTSTYNSRIENFSWTPITPVEVSKQHTGTLLGVGIF